jgi:hypothetical protein
MSYLFDVSTLPLDQLCDLISECRVANIEWKIFYGGDREPLTSIELPWQVLIEDKTDALYAQIKWNLILVTNTTSDI